MASVLYFYFLSVFGWPVLFNFFSFFFFFTSPTRIYMLNSAIIYHHSLYLHQFFFTRCGVYVCLYKTKVPGCLYLKSMAMIRLDAILCDLRLTYRYVVQRGEKKSYKVHVVGLGRSRRVRSHSDHEPGFQKNLPALPCSWCLDSAGCRLCVITCFAGSAGPGISLIYSSRFAINKEGCFVSSWTGIRSELYLSGVIIIK